MSNYEEIIVDVSTNETIIRPYTQAEIELLEAAKKEAELKTQSYIEEHSKKAALLEKLGITEEEAKLLLG